MADCITTYNGSEKNGRVMADICNFLLNKGFTINQMAGIMGNISVESEGYKIDSVGDNGTSFGICQWHNERGTRMKEFVKKNGKDWRTDLDSQLDYLWQELNSSYKKHVLDWYHNNPNASVEDSEARWETYFEGCGKCNRPKRLLRAKEALEFYKKYASGECSQTTYFSSNEGNENQSNVDGEGTAGNNIDSGSTIGTEVDKSKMQVDCGINVSVINQQTVINNNNDSGSSVSVNAENMHITSDVASPSEFTVLGTTKGSQKRTGTKYIVIHYTGEKWTSEPGTYTHTVDALINNPKHGPWLSDFIIDDGTIVQMSPDIDKYAGKTVGIYGKDSTPNNKRGVGARNSNSFSIEARPMVDREKFEASGDTSLQPNKDYFSFSPAVLNNIAKLCRYLMKKYNIPKERVIRHYDIQGKSCPGIIGWNPISGSEDLYWAFINAL